MRYSDDGDSTQGLLFVNGVFFCHTLEDTYRETKVPDKTRIPEGTYDLVLRSDISPKTQDYMQRFKWFDRHLMLKDVPNFKYIYLHIGNTTKDTSGCILVGDKANNNQKSHGFLGTSTEAFSRFYKKVRRAIRHREPVTITIIDMDRDMKRLFG